LDGYRLAQINDANGGKLASVVAVNFDPCAFWAAHGIF